MSSKDKPVPRNQIGGVSVSAPKGVKLEVNTGRFVEKGDSHTLVDEKKIIVDGEARTFPIFDDGSFSVGPHNENPPAGKWVWLTPEEIEIIARKTT